MRISRRKFLALGSAALGSAISGNILGCASPFVHKEGKLEVNLDPNTFDVYEKSEEEGVKDLVELARKGFVEESFVYLRKKCSWIEEGDEEEPESVRANYGVALHYKNELPVQYHTHVLVARWMELKHYFPDKDYMPDERLFEFMIENRGYPSLTDIMKHEKEQKESIKIFRDFASVFRQINGYKIKVVGHKGAIEYTGFIDFIIKSMEAFGDWPYFNLLTAYGYALSHDYIFLDNWFTEELMSRLQPESRFKYYKEDEFKILLSEFMEMWSDFKASKFYRGHEAEPGIEELTKAKREAGLQEAKDRFRILVDTYISALTEPSSAWEAKRSQQKH